MEGNARLEEALDKYDFLRFIWSDIHGHPRGKTIPRGSVACMWDEGVHTFTGNLALGPRYEVPSFPDVEHQGWGNMQAKAVPSTLAPVPWAGAGRFSIGQVLSECWEENDGPARPHGVCSRTLARQQVERLHEEFGLQLCSAFESEFQVLNATSKELVDSEVKLFSHLTLAKYEEIMFDIQSQLQKAGIKVETIQMEYGPSQFEMALAPNLGIKSLDNYFILKNAVKEMMTQKGYQAVFMTRPFVVKGCANGGHYNFSLADADGKNVFFDEGDPQKMSAIFRHWLAGVLHHSPALTALCSPTVNCYRRLHQMWVPHQADWGIDNRVTCYRVKTLSPTATYVESRLVSATANPYLVGAGILAAGMDGLKNKMELQPSGLSDKYQVLPQTLQDALECLERDVALCEALGERFMKWFAMEKREFEVKPLKEHNISKMDEQELVKERAMYLEMF